jgi:hypothetical protein
MFNGMAYHSNSAEQCHVRRRVTASLPDGGGGSMVMCQSMTERPKRKLSKSTLEKMGGSR